MLEIAIGNGHRKQEARELSNQTDMNAARECVRNWADGQRDINRLYFFGSRVWGTPRANSDLDIFIVARDSGAGILGRKKWIDQLTRQLIWPPHLIEYFTANSTLIEKIKSDGVLVFSRHANDTDFPGDDDKIEDIDLI